MVGLIPIVMFMWLWLVDTAGRVLGSAPFTADYEKLGDWLQSHGSVVRVGVEGTGSYGAGLARHLTRACVKVVEVNRPNRQLRRFRGKTDIVDAENAARAALSGQATAQPKSGDRPVEAIRMLGVVRRSAIKARTQTINQLHALVVTAPEQVKHQLGELTPKDRVKVCAAFRPRPDDTTIAYAKQALRILARRYQTLTTEITELDTHINRLCVRANPALLATPGIGADTAATLLIAAGDGLCVPPTFRHQRTFGCSSLAQPTLGRQVQHVLDSDYIGEHISGECPKGALVELCDATFQGRT